MVLFVREPSRYLTQLLRKYVRFGLLSGLTINWDKSIIIPLTVNTSQPIMEYPLIWTSDPVKYLGIWVHRDPDLVIQANYGRACSTLDQHVDKWIALPLSLEDRIALTKMVVLPRFLFIYQHTDIAV